MNAKGIFDHKDEALVIELVRQHPSLWNTADSNYQKKCMKKLLYMQIAEELKKRWPDKAHLLTGDSVRHKFNTLKSYFQREQRKMKAWDKISTVRMFPKWIHFDKMLFVTEKDGRNESECDLNISSEKVEEEISNGDKELEHNDSVAETNWSDSNEGKDSFLLLQSPIQSNEGVFEPSVKIEVPDDSASCSNGNIRTDSSLLLQSNEENFKPSVKMELPDDSPPVCVSFMTETSDNTIIAETRYSDRNEGTDSSLSIQSNEEDAEPFLKEKNLNDSSPVRNSLNIETPVNSTFAETSYSSSNEETYSTPPLQPSIQSNNETVESPLKRKKLSNSSPVCDSTETEIPVTAVVSEISCSNSNERTDSSLSFRPSVQSNGKAAEPPLKRKKLLLVRRVTPSFLEQRSPLINKKKKPNNSSPMCDSTETETPVILKTWSASSGGPPTFNVTLGNLVVASLNQMPAEKANAATKEILDVLLKYGRETNHLR